MTDGPAVREIGRIEDMDGSPVVIGVDHDTVTIEAVPRLDGPLTLTRAMAEEFAQLFVAACWQAGRQEARMPGGTGAS